MSYDRGNIKVKMKQSPLKYGDYFFDIGTSITDLLSDSTLYIGTGTGNDWEWTPDNYRDGGYIKVGGAGSLNIIGHITELPTTHKTGVIYIADNNISVPNGTITNSNTDLRVNDLLIDTGDEFLKISSGNSTSSSSSSSSTAAITYTAGDNVIISNDNKISVDLSSKLDNTTSKDNAGKSVIVDNNGNLIFGTSGKTYTLSLENNVLSLTDNEGNIQKVTINNNNSEIINNTNSIATDNMILDFIGE